MRWVITGASRGIGLEFAKQIAGRGDTVEAGAREPEGASDLRALSEGSKGRVRVHACDVGDEASVAAFARAVGPEPIDVLLNNAGVTGKRAGLESLDFADMMKTFETNALGALRVTKALVDQVLASETRRIVHVTSGMASIADNTSGGSYGYRMSKAALNMANRSLSVDLAPKRAVCVVINPGWVKTDMGGPNAFITVAESVKKMLVVLDGLTEKDTGRFLSFSGKDYAY